MAETAAPAPAPTPSGPARRRRRLAPFVALPVGLVLVGFVVVLARGKPAVDRIIASPLLGKPAPALQGTTIDGAPFSLANQKGTWVVVNFFAPWCTGCRQEQPDLVTFSQRHQTARDAELVGVIFNDTAANVRSFRQSEGGGWPMVIDPSGATAVDFGVSALPETFVIDPNGYVQARFSSPVTADGLDRVIDDLRNGVDPSKR